MKKKYEKPIFIIESFQLDASISASCSSQGYIPINYGENNCTFEGEFFSGFGDCTNYKECQAKMYNVVAVI